LLLKESIEIPIYFSFVFANETKIGYYQTKYLARNLDFKSIFSTLYILNMFNMKIEKR